MTINNTPLNISDIIPGSDNFSRFFSVSLMGFFPELLRQRFIYRITQFRIKPMAIFYENIVRSLTISVPDGTDLLPTVRGASVYP